MPQVTSSRAAFTLVELLMASSLSLLAILVSVSSYTLVRKSSTRLDDASAREQTLRVAMNMLQRDIRMAGYGVSARGAAMIPWFSYAGTITDSVMVAYGGVSNSGDRLTLVGAFGSVTSSLKTAAAAGASLLDLRVGDGPLFNATDRCVVLVGGVEMARISSVYGDALIVSLDPQTNGVGLRFAHEAGASIDLIEVASYQPATVTNLSGVVSCIEREAYWTGTEPADRVIAGDIEEFRVSRHGDAELSIAMTARSRKEEPGYTNVLHGDGHRRSAITSIVRRRNG